MEKDPARERRIDYEIVVDAYDEYEVAQSWRIYLEDHLTFPFEAHYLPNAGAEPVRVTVTELEDEDETRDDSDGEDDDLDEEDLDEEDDFEDEDDGQAPDLEFRVTMVWDGDEFSAALEHIFPLGADAGTLEAVLDWHYWQARS